MKLKMMLLSFFLISIIIPTKIEGKTKEVKSNLKIVTIGNTRELYNQIGLSGEMDYKVFKLAIKGYNKIKTKNSDNILIVDFTQISNEERFYFIDLKNKKIKYKTFVAHGKNSGAERAINFSNQLNSYKSSLGFYLTGKHYEGYYGYSAKLHGLEEGINTNALVRTIVIHGASASEESYIDKFGFLGRTEGCFGLPLSISKEIIEAIPEQTVLFVYGEDEYYFEKSNIL